MLTIIEQALDADTVRRFRTRLEAAAWEDGRVTAGSLAAQVKQNRQLPESADTARELGNHILRTLGQHPLFLSAALPNRIYPPRFNRYAGGEHYGAHVDGAIMALPDSRDFLRSDISCTLFLSRPDEYDGGELTIETRFGAQRVKLEAGDLVLYPSSSLHEVTAVTRGERLCSFFWIQSLVADHDQRALLFDLDRSIQALTADGIPAQRARILELSGIYYNLLRRWSQP